MGVNQKTKSTVSANAGQPVCQRNVQIPRMMSDAEKQQIKEQVSKGGKGAQITIIRYLLKKGYDVNAVNEIGATPLYFACENLNVDVILMLLKNGAKLTYSTTFYPMKAVSSKFLRYYNAVGASGRRMLQEKVCRILEAFFERGMLLDASKPIDREVAQEVLTHGSKKLVRLFARYQFDFETAKTLHHFVEHGNLALAEELMRCVKIDINNQSSYGAPLHIAAYYGQDECAAMLIDRGCNVDIKMGKNITALKSAFVSKSEGSDKVFERLIRSRTSVKSVIDDESLQRLLADPKFAISRISTRKIIALAQHLLKMDLIGLKTESLQLVLKDQRIKHKMRIPEFLANCNTELEQMRKKFSCDWFSLFYDISENVKDNSWYFNDEVIKYFDAKNHEEQFPLYWKTLDIVYHAASASRQLLKKKQPVIASVTQDMAVIIIN